MNTSCFLMFRKLTRHIGIVFLSIVLTGSCYQATAASSREVLTTILPLYIFTANILNGINGVHLQLLIEGENANPHVYTMTVQGVKKIASAEVIIANGKAEEFFDLGKIKDLNPRARVVLTHQVSSRVSYLSPIDARNPHTWLSPKRAIIECEEIGKALQEAFPEYDAAIGENVKIYRKKLEVLSERIFSMVSKAGGFDIITFHDALDIFAIDFGASILYHIEEVHGIPPSPKRLADILDTIKAKGGKVILVSESPEPDTITSMIAGKTDAPVVWFDPIISGEKNVTRYEETMLRNVEKLISSFTM